MLSNILSNSSVLTMIAGIFEVFNTQLYNSLRTVAFYKDKMVMTKLKRMTEAGEPIEVKADNRIQIVD